MYQFSQETVGQPSEDAAEEFQRRFSVISAVSPLSANFMMASQSQAHHARKQPSRMRASASRASQVRASSRPSVTKRSSVTKRPSKTRSSVSTETLYENTHKASLTSIAGYQRRRFTSMKKVIRVSSEEHLEPDFLNHSNHFCLPSMNSLILPYTL